MAMLRVALLTLAAISADGFSGPDHEVTDDDICETCCEEGDAGIEYVLEKTQKVPKLPPISRLLARWGACNTRKTVMLSGICESQ